MDDHLCLTVLLLGVIGIVHGGAPIYTFPSGNYITVLEEIPIGSQLFTFYVYDPTPSHSLTIAREGSTTETFVNINVTGPDNNRTVVVTTNHRLDREASTGGKITLRFSADDSNFNKIYVELDVYIKDINDNPPVFDRQSYRWEIPELPWNDSLVFKDIKATDADNFDYRTIRYSMEPNSQSETAKDEYRRMFSIDNTTGDISLRHPLDYSNNTFYQFTVIAKNPDDVVPPGEANFTTADFIINVLDRQNKPPFFTGVPYRTEIHENIVTGSPVKTVAALDGDTGLPNPVNFTIQDGPCSSLFTISSSTGLITTAHSIDRDSGEINNQNGICILKILVQEIENGDHIQYGNTSATTDVTITVNDMNDNSPEFGNTTYHANIQENAARNIPITLTQVTDMTVSDADADLAYTTMAITLKYENGSDCSDFVASPAVIRKSGSVIIKVDNSALLDYEMIQHITILVIAQETNNITHVATATVSLTILDMNDNNPEFHNETYEFTIDESSRNNTTVGYLNATDKDSDIFGPVVYKLSGGNNRFGVDSNSGRVFTVCNNCATELDRETVDIYYMTVTAMDINGTSGARSDSTSLVVNLRDINDNAPKFSRTSPIQVYIDENDGSYNDTALIQVQAIDNDKPGTKNSEVRYKLESVSQTNMDGNITVDNTTGEVFLVHAVDFENLTGTGDKRIIEIVIKAHDLGDTPQENNITVVIEVQDMNDNSPVFINQSFNGSVYENETSTSSNLVTVGGVLAEDADGSDRNKKINYYIISGSSDRFTINSLTGHVSIQLGAMLDRETTDTYNMTIMAIDQGSPPRNATAHMIVKVLDVNDELPVFNQSTYSVSIKENITNSIKDVFFTCNATDEDTNHDLQYSMSVTGAENEDGESVNISRVQDYFDIHPSNGSVYINSVTDRETVEIVVIKLNVEDVNAYDPSSQTATATLTVTLLDINDNKPEFTEDVYQMSVSENARDPTRLDAILATDKDVNRTIVYSLLDEDNLSFRIDHVTGTIIKNGPIDRETNTSIMFMAVATDNGVPPLNSTCAVNVTLIDFNDNAPEFLMNVTSTTIEENCNHGTPVFDVNATDKDEGVNAEIRYSCTNCQPSFSINETSGLITTIDDIDREQTSQYELHIEAKDQPNNIQEQKSTTVTITVKIQDINDNAPEFTKPVYTENVVEGVTIGTTVLSVSATDDDEIGTNNTEISYRFVNNTIPPGLFMIDEKSGVISTNKSLRSLYGWYVISVMAQDHGDPQLNGTALVNISVIDVNDNKPIITNIPTNSTIKAYECTRLGFELYYFNYTDADEGINREAYFNISKIQESDNIAVFHLYPNGSLTLKQKLNYTIQREFQFQISATDKGDPPLSSDKHTITVRVIDVNDHEPSFTSHHTTINVLENKPKNTHVGFVTAVDPDSDSTSCYKIVDGPWAHSFTVGNTTGEIFTQEQFDRENTSYSNISFNLTVVDCSIMADPGVACANDTNNNNKDVIDNIKVNVNIEDVNDNPPEFINDEIVTGMRRTTEVGTILELNLKDKQYVSDLDSDQNGIFAWRFRNNGSITSSPGMNIPSTGGALTCADSKTHLFCISENGSIVSNKYFQEDLSGFFLVPVSVHDGFGSDISQIRIYLIADSQILIMVILGSKEDVSQRKDDVLKLYSEITGHTFVYDGIADHKTSSGGIDPLKTDLYFHVVEPKSQRILSTEEAIRLIDENALRLQEAMRQYSVIEVVSSKPLTQEEDNKGKTIIVLAAVVAVLAVTVIIIVYVAINTRIKYQRKLKAATIVSEDEKTIVADNPLFVPGSNVYSRQSNPLLNSEMPVANNGHFDSQSLSSSNSLDVNDVGEIRADNISTIYDAIEEREVTMDLFNDDSRVAKDVESPLDAALRLHSMHAETNMNNDEDIPDEEGRESLRLSGIYNEVFEGDLESTEI